MILLACFGLTFILMRGKPTAFLRTGWLKPMLDCAFCTGFWASIIIYLCSATSPNIHSGLIIAFAGSGTSGLLYTFFKLAEKYL